jgi:hypothetical protein
MSSNIRTAWEIKDLSYLPARVRASTSQNVHIEKEPSRPPTPSSASRWLSGLSPSKWFSTSIDKSAGGQSSLLGRLQDLLDCADESLICWANEED